MVAAIDRSPCAQPVLATAQALADALSAEVSALYVSEGDEPPTEAAADWGIRLEVRHGQPADVILEVFSAPGALGVIGARDRAEDQRPTGRTTARVILQVTRPVVVVSPRTRPLRHGRLSRVLLPLDGTAAAATSLEDLAEAFSAAGLDLTVHHVFEHATAPTYWDQPQHEAHSWGREFQRRWCDRPGTSVTGTFGEAADEIVAAVEDERSDMILLSWAQNSVPGRAEVVKAVLKEAGVPVLLTRTAH
jgi:nucleotide-binding universal stress UspA family protein